MSSTDYSRELDEIHKNQQLLIESLDNERQNYPEDRSESIDNILSRASDYHVKLVNLKRSLQLINERTSELKKRADRMLEIKEKNDLEIQRTKERQEMLERHLEPVVNTKRLSKNDG